MMNASSSECSSGCDSGWTLYFQSSTSDAEPNALLRTNPKKGRFGNKGFEDEEEEDLSMVSDASSGPPVHYDAIDADEVPHQAVSKNDYKRRKMDKQGQGRDFRCLLDDTASSPAIINNHYVWKAGVEIIPEGRRSAYQEQHSEFLHSDNITATGDHDNQWFGSRNTKEWR